MLFRARIVSLVLAVFLILAWRSVAISPWNFRKFSRILADTKSEEKVSPAPSPGSSGSKGPGSKAGPTGGEGCLASSEACHVKDLSACLLYAGTAPKEAFLLLQNSGEVPVKVNVTFSPTNITLDEIQIAQQEVTKVNVTSKVRGISSIVLNAGGESCVVQIKSQSPTSRGNFYKNFPYASQVSPIHGVYLLFAIVLLIGGVWACCSKYGKNERRVDGIPYQELEMGRTEGNSITVVDEETVVGWDESWDDDWGDEIREVKPSPSQSRVGNGSANGHPSKSVNKDGWDESWND